MDSACASAKAGTRDSARAGTFNTQKRASWAQELHSSAAKMAPFKHLLVSKIVWYCRRAHQIQSLRSSRAEVSPARMAGGASSSAVAARTTSAAYSGAFVPHASRKLLQTEQMPYPVSSMRCDDGEVEQRQRQMATRYWTWAAKACALFALCAASKPHLHLLETTKRCCRKNGIERTCSRGR